ncbi:TetR/AcrR family transcriptional regulator [Erwinia persicina]|uniref:TetR/AcrR family transcriptional regulator n=1 Tax=Erwinia persicina TaxID=55211 RepID=UPI0007868692|nr:TetR/AcrR family transcriptional regulator [Erwinia persicina]MBD8169904.1 TetR/AcrR family transcriptional regulator [Erwinia persicina]
MSIDNDSSPLPRRRLSREARYQQLIDTAWQLIHDEGTEALTLGRLAAQSGVTKPVVYDHFGTRSGLFAVLYQEFDARQNALFDAALAKSEATLSARAAVIAQSFVECVQLQGREIPGIIAALIGSPELEQIKRAYEVAFIEKCRGILSPFSEGGELTNAGLWAMLGAAESLSYAATRDEITIRQAQDELFSVIMALVERSRRRL